MTAPGIVYMTDRMGAAELSAFALRIEGLGYDALWLPELLGREPIATAGWLLARTERLRVVTGIANVYARDALAAAQARRTLAELSGGRFVLGLGVSHPPMAEARGQKWVMPVPKLRAYLDGIRAAQLRSPEPPTPAPIWIAAHGPGLLRLAREKADGANTYLMPPQHTREAREILGPEKTLTVVLSCCLCSDVDRARQIVRRGLRVYMSLPAYQQRWRDYGFADTDFADGGSDRLIDMLTASGTETQIRDRINTYREAGATQVEIIPLNPEGGAEPAWKLLEALAPASAQ